MNTAKIFLAFQSDDSSILFRTEDGCEYEIEFEDDNEFNSMFSLSVFPKADFSERRFEPLLYSFIYKMATNIYAI